MSDAADAISWARVGDVLAGKYRVERVIGSGGMGLVVAARHVHLGEKVAVKLLLPGARMSPAALERFFREGRAAARIRGEHVARVHDAGVLDTGEPYLVLEHLDGVDLGALLARAGKLPVETAILYVLQTCEAVAEAHALGVIHRDLKPGNLFLAKRADGSDCVKVIDFGISKLAASARGEGASLTARDTAIGTPSYMAPEQMRSARDVDERADVWAIGAVLYRLVAGAPPFEGEAMIEVYDRILRGGPPSMRDVPEALAGVIRRCLQADPDDRYPDVGALAEALADVAPPEARISAERAIRIARSRAREAEATLESPAIEPSIEAPATAPTSATEEVKAPSWGPSPAPPSAVSAAPTDPPRARSKRWIAAIGAALTVGVTGILAVKATSRAAPPAERARVEEPAARPADTGPRQASSAPSAQGPIELPKAPSAAAQATAAPVARPPSRKAALPAPRPTAVMPNLPGFSETPD